MRSTLRLVLLLLFIFSVSCKKAIERKKEAILMDAITSGTWIVEQYFENTTNISAEFLHYDFQFYRNSTVTGTQSGVTTNGTWTGDMSNSSITAEFPAAGDPLKKLNGLWKITDSYWDYVEAEMKTNIGKNILHLRKKS